MAALFLWISVLALLALVTLVAKPVVDWRMRQENAMLDASLAPEGGAAGKQSGGGS